MCLLARTDACDGQEMWRVDPDLETNCVASKMSSHHLAITHLRTKHPTVKPKAIQEKKRLVQRNKGQVTQTRGKGDKSTGTVGTPQAVQDVHRTCRGARCEPSADFPPKEEVCRSEHGYCGVGADYCNARSTWRPRGCLGAEQRLHQVKTGIWARAKGKATQPARKQHGDGTKYTKQRLLLAENAYSEAVPDRCAGLPCPENAQIGEMCRSRFHSH